VTATIFDDLEHRRELPALLDLARRSGRLPIAHLRRIALGTASWPDRERHGEEWTEALIDLLTRAGLDELGRRAGQVVFLVASDLPRDAAEAWDRAMAARDAAGLDFPRGGVR
jgi:hypothetical protein